MKTIFSLLYLPHLQEIIIGEECFTVLKDDLVIESYQNLKEIIVKKGALINLNSLKICNNEKLKTIKIESTDTKHTLRNVKDVIIESILSNSTLV